MDLKNRKLIKEWKKIEHSHLFQTFEEFAEFYYANGQKFCYKKFTNEEWTPENFFFGTYEELLEFYKTDTTIPYSAQQRIGQKFNSLTILDLFAENLTGKKVIYAKCKCDCGNNTIKVLKDVVKGDVGTCGGKFCRKKRMPEKPIEIIPIEQSIIDEFWDYEKNGDVDPLTISYNSKQLFWWKDSAGNSFQLAPCVYAKKENPTKSFPEQAIFYYVRKYYPSAINEAKFLTTSGKTVEIDIYIPTLNIGIEYDGAFWHANKEYEDTYKNDILSNDGVFLIRVREKGLPLLRGFNGVIIKRGKYLISSNNDLVKIINQILSIIGSFADQPKNHTITEDDFENNLYSIYALIHSTPTENSIAKTCLMQYWDSERNGDLNPNCISLTSTLPIHFICKIGKRLSVSPKVYVNKMLEAQFQQYICQNQFHCDEDDCCPFKNLSLCKPIEACLFRKGFGLPKLKCIGKIEFDSTKKFKKSAYNSKNNYVYITMRQFLRIEFENTSAFPFYTQHVESFWIKSNTILRLNNYLMTNNNVSITTTVNPNESLQYLYCIPDRYVGKMINGKLILYHQLFKDEYMRGWRFYIFLIIDFDDCGNIIHQESKIVSDTEFEYPIRFNYNNIDDLRALIKKIIKL